LVTSVYNVRFSLLVTEFDNKDSLFFDRRVTTFLLTDTSYEAASMYPGVWFHTTSQLP